MTLVPLPGGRVRVAFNRDEQRVRSAALPPTLRRYGNHEGLAPTDPLSGGTWLGINDAGLTLALLNANPAGGPGREPLRSRGEIIPTLLACATPAEALARFGPELTYGDFAPFRLIVFADGLVAEVYWDGAAPMVRHRLLGNAPLMFTSSGLGDGLVDPPRRELFEEMLIRCGPHVRVAAQDDYHRHRWAGREPVSVNMERAEARTVSLSVIEIREEEARFDYYPDAPDRPAVPFRFSLRLQCEGVT